jgi:hypothetical protein
VPRNPIKFTSKLPVKASAEFKPFKLKKKVPRIVEEPKPEPHRPRVLNEKNHDPKKQIPLRELVIRIVSLAQVLMEKRYYPYQVSLSYRIIESLLLHDGETITSLMARQAGKCLAKGTKILMFDGTVKNVEDVVIGDLLMGDDSTPRTVLSLARGRETMYRVQPRCNYAEAYEVNESHILSVKERKKRSTDLITRDMSIKEYLALPQWKKNDKIVGYKVPIEYPHAEVPIDPYWLGLWLGDGHSNSTAITCSDPEVIDFLGEFSCTLDGMRMSVYEERGRCASIALVNENPSRSKPNPIIEVLRELRVLNNKHIPFAYLVNSREVRLKVLAGLIDSDGHISRNHCLEITQVNKNLADDIVKLCRSLGFRASMVRKVAECQTGACSVVWKVSVYGDLSIIPVLVKRKKSLPVNLRENPLTYGFDVVKLKKGEYFGFSIDGNKRFVLGDFTVTHNTETVGGTVAACAIMLPILANKYPDDWRLNITDEQGNYRGFRHGVKVGIYAPKHEQSQITFERVRGAIETKTSLRVLRELNVKAETNNGNTVSLTNGSEIICQSASDQSKIEGATHHLLIAEEAQDISDMKMRKSLHPMTASTKGTIVKIGTASTQKCDFYNAIKENRRFELETGKKNHYFFPWTVCSKYNSLYREFIEGEKRKIGEQSDEFRMSYGGEWIFERGMFIPERVLFDRLIATREGIWSDYHWKDRPGQLKYHDVVAGIDWGQTSDSTVVCLMAVDWRNPISEQESWDMHGVHKYVQYHKHIIGWLEFLGDTYETQFHEIYNTLIDVPGLRKIIMDSNTCGKPMFDRFSAVFSMLGKGIEIEPFNFSAKVKSDGYKSFASDLQSKSITFPAGPNARDVNYKRFVFQMLDLKKEYKSGLMYVSHPDERGAHDDYCFPAGSLIETDNGEVPIEKIKVGDMVLTRNGFRKVLVSSQTGIKEVIKRGKLVGTPNHPVFCVNKGMYVRLDALIPSDTVLVCERRLFTTESSSTDTPTPNGDNFENTIGHTQGLNSLHSRSMFTSGKNLKAKFQKALLSITRMGIPKIINSQIWSLWTELLTRGCTLLSQGVLSWLERISKLLVRQQWLPVGTNLLSELPVLENAQKVCGTVGPIQSKNVQNVAVDTELEILASHTLVPISVRELELGATNVAIPDGPVPVFNLSVEGDNEYFCNKILVHNCDAAMLAAWGCRTPAVSGIVEVAGSNPFFS